MNLHTIKSFHEAALDQWNSLSIILKDAVNAASPAQRASTFLDAVCSLLELAGTNQARRQNVLKSADIVLQPLFHEGVTTPKPQPTTPPRPSPWKRALRIGLRGIGALVICCLIAGAFWLGRVSMRPEFVQFVPLKYQAPVVDPKRDAPPEQIVQQYFEAVQRNDMPAVLALCHTEETKYRTEMLVSEAEQLGRAFPTLKTIQMLQVTTEETARILMNLEDKNGRTEQGEFLLKKFQGQWKLVDIQI